MISNVIKRVLIVILVFVLTLATLASCAESNTIGDGNAGGDSSDGSNPGGNNPGGNNPGGNSQGGYNSGGGVSFENVDSGRTDGVFTMTGSWERNGIVNHFHGGTNVGPINYFVVEGLYRMIVDTDVFVPMLAEGPMEHIDELTSRIKIRQNAKWHNGDDFTSQDVVAFYYLVQTQATNYMLDIIAADEKTVEIQWNPNRPISNYVKEGLVAQDRQGTIQYNEFKPWVDEVMRLTKEAPLIPADSDENNGFGRLATSENLRLMDANFAGFRNRNPSWFVATGPYMIESVSPSEMVLIRNPDYWAVDNVRFEKIIIYSISNINQEYNMLSIGQIDYKDGLAPYDTMEAILRDNPDMAHIKMADNGSIGLVFNFEKPIWTPKVREAFQYIFDRDEVKFSGNAYGITMWNAPAAMSDTERQYWLSEEHYNMISTYEYNKEKASQLLEEAGWTRQGGRWYVDGSPLALTIGTTNDHPGMSGTADAVQAQLIDFGIDVTLLKPDSGGLWNNGTMENSLYDMTIFWTELNMSLLHPYGGFSQWSSQAANYAHMPRYTAADLTEATRGYINMVNLEFDYLGAGGGKIGFSDKLNNYYALQGEELENYTASIVVGLANMMYGVNFYQNVTGSFINVGKISGIPLEEYWSVSRNVEYVPQMRTEEFSQVARTNIIWAGASAFVEGMYKVR